MTKLRPLSTIALAGALLLPTGAAVGQDEAAVSPAAEAIVAAEDSRLVELEALVPPVLAGLSLSENLQLATGEQIASVMQPEEVAALGDLLEANSKTTADYAAAATYLEASDTQIVHLQAHRIAGVEASETIDAWVEILSLGLARPEVSEDSIGGRPVTFMSDATKPEAPQLAMFPALDVTWMIWTDDQTLVGAAMDEVGAEVRGEGSE